MISVHPFLELPKREFVRTPRLPESHRTSGEATPRRRKAERDCCCRRQADSGNA